MATYERCTKWEDDVLCEVNLKAHVISPEEVLEGLAVDASVGLSTEEHSKRLEKYGPNLIPEAAKTTALERLWEQINSFVIYILIVGAVVSFGFKHHLDGFVILGVVFINVFIGFYMESKAVSATEALKNMMSSTAQVIRSGTKLVATGSSLTLGDIFFLQPGDIVPADGRVLRAVNLSVLEAALTGESHAINKEITANAHINATLADRKCMVFSGTQVLQGTAIVVATAIGAECEIGKISGLLAAIKPEKTPLLVQLDRFGQILSAIIIILALITFGAAYARGHSVASALGIAIGVSVAFIPEGLPSCITVTFSIGVKYMAAKNAIIKSLPSVETLGSVSVICSDKTGTLTQNNMTVKSVYTPIRLIQFGDKGEILLAPHQQQPQSANESPDPSAAAVATVADAAGVLGALLPGLLCNDSIIRLDCELTERNSDNGQLLQQQSHCETECGDIEAPAQIVADNEEDSNCCVVEGDPTETCIVKVGIRYCSSAETMRNLLTATMRKDEIPFDSATKYMATLHDIDAKHIQMIKAATLIPSDYDWEQYSEGKYRVIMIKGAPERVLDICYADTASKANWLAAAEQLAQQGMRVLALAMQVVGNATTNAEDYQLPESLPTAAATAAAALEEGKNDNAYYPHTRFCMISLVGIMDPPRPEAIVAVRDAQQAGITVKMITGDHPSTATAIGRLLGLKVDRSTAITGPELDQITITSTRNFDETILRNDVFARTTPEHKLRIVESLRRQGLVSSMTGDGVNDAPALKAANIGVAMGITGTDVAKDAAHMVITDDNFATIIDAICVGRSVYANLIKIITFVLPSNGGQAFSIIGALIINVEVPITALQILWVNMITSVTLGIVLAFDRPNRRVLEDPPRRADKGIFGQLLLWRMASVTILLVLVVLGSFEWEAGRNNHSVHYLRTVAVNALSVAQIGYVLNCRDTRRNISPYEIFGCDNAFLYVGISAVIVFQVLFTYSPGFQYVFVTEPLDAISWGKIVLLAICVFIVVEVDKYIAAQTKECRNSMFAQHKQRGRALTN